MLDRANHDSAMFINRLSKRFTCHLWCVDQEIDLDFYEEGPKTFSIILCSQENINNKLSDEELKSICLALKNDFNDNPDCTYMVSDQIDYHSCSLLFSRKDKKAFILNTSQVVDFGKQLCLTAINPSVGMIFFFRKRLRFYLTGLDKRMTLTSDSNLNNIKHFSLNLFHSISQSYFSARHKQVAAEALLEYLNNLINLKQINDSYIFQEYAVNPERLTSIDLWSNQPMQHLTNMEDLSNDIFSKWIAKNPEWVKCIEDSTTLLKILKDGELGKITTLILDFFSHFFKCLITPEMEVKKNIAVIAQGARQSHCLFNILPPELNIKIAAFTGSSDKDTHQNLSDDITPYYEECFNLKRQN